MSGLSLFKIQSLVAMVLCTSLNAGAVGVVTGGSVGAGTTSPTLLSPPAEDSTVGSSASISDNAAKFCELAGNYKSNCKKDAAALLQSMGGSSDPKNEACSLARDNDTSKSSDASSKQDALFGAIEKQADMAMNAAKTKEEADALVAQAKLKYDQAISDLNIGLPIQQESIRNKVAKEMLTLKNAMIDIGKDIMAADNELRAAEMAVTAAQNSMISKCTSFAGSKANKKLDDFDKAFAAVKGAQNTFINYNSTNVSGAKNRRNAKRARDAQAAYMSAYSACMSGAADPNGGDIGPGPDLAEQNKAAAQAYETAKGNHAKALELIEMKKQNLKEQMAQMEIGMATEIKAAVAQAQSRANQALTEYNLAQTEATKMVRIGSLEMTYKGGFVNQQVEMLKGQAGAAAQAAQQANVTAMIKCGDTGANLFQKQLQQQNQLQRTIQDAAGAARRRY